MKKTLLLLLLHIGAMGARAQCAAGAATASLNWDALKYLSPNTYVTAAMAANQNFALGKNKVNIQYTGTVSTVGENAAHTGSAGSYGAGNDVQYAGNGTITLTFATAVSNVKFSVYDNDKGQTTTVSALNSGVATAVTLTKANTTSTNISISGATVTSSTGNESESANTTSFNVDVAGPVTSITLTITNTNTVNGGSGDSEYWLSDISACHTSSFPTNYYNVSRPWGTMPGYVLVAANSSIYMLDPATGNAKFIFSDGATSGTLNSLAYDPYNKIIYYTFSLTNNGSSSASDKRVRKYDMNTKTSTTILNDITSLGIPTFSQGVESGAAAFYDGAYYIGIEGGADRTGGNPNTSTGYKSIIWRLDFTGDVPTSATQVFAANGDTHDWSDFSMNDGVLYDFNGDAATPDYRHLNMQTGALTVVPYVSTTPRQSATGWDGKIYWISNQIAEYNGAGGLGTKYTITANPAIPNWGTNSSPSFGDGGEAFRPKADFGDAAATYDPDATAPAVHELNANLRLGATLDDEWNKTASANADADGGDEDGLPFVTILNQNSGNYLTQVDVFNNTGAPATVAAWVDFNNNGVFESGEGTTATVQTATSVQRIDLFWSGITTSLPAFSNVFMRIRVTSASNLMTRDHPTGYFANGEVEDYKVLVNQATLPLRITNFSVTRSGANAEISWTGVEEDTNVEYTLERSTDTRNWNTIFSKKLAAASAFNNHQFLDVSPATPYSYYRLKYKGASNEVKYTQIKKVDFAGAMQVQISPNPATDFLQIELTANDAGKCAVRLYSIDGKEVLKKQVAVNKGYNKLPLALAPQTPDGVYNATILMNGQVFFRKIVISK